MHRSQHQNITCHAHFVAWRVIMIAAAAAAAAGVVIVIVINVACH